MIIKVRFEYEDDIEYMVCPAKVGRNINQLQKDFFKWLYNRENAHPYWEIFEEDEEGNITYGVCYRTEAFIYWLNKVRFNKGKSVARLIEVPNIPPKKTIRF